MTTYPTIALLRERYQAGLLTPGELYEALTALSVPLELVAVAFDPAIVAGLSEWQTAVRAGARVIGGERDPDP